MRNFLFLLFIYSLCSFAQAKSEQCDDLITYRDTNLIKDFDKASKKLTMAQDSLKLLKKVQLETQNLIDKQPTINKVFQFVLSVKTVNNAIAGILKLNPETGALVESAGKANQWIENIFIASESVELADAIADSKIETYLFWQTIGDYSTLGSAVKSINQFTEDLIEQKNESDDGDEILTSLQEQLNSLNKELNKAQQRINNSSNVITSINEFKNQIDYKCK